MNMTSGAIAISCAGGLFLGTADATTPKELKREPTVDGAALWVAVWGVQVAVATADRVYLRQPDGSWWWEWSSAGEHRNCSHSDHDYAGGAVEFTATVGAFDPSYSTSGGLWLGSEYGLQVWDLATGELRRVGRIEGLPSPNITVLLPSPAGSAPCGQAAPASSEPCLWMGTVRGIARHREEESKGERHHRWTYLRRKRWLPGDDVTAMASLGGGRLLVATADGVSVLEGQAYTLAQKADQYQAMVSPRHSRYGYVSECGLKTAGDLSGYYYKDSDNDG
jgi:ligand-binding sensor domain-containing protein